MHPCVGQSGAGSPRVILLARFDRDVLAHTGSEMVALMNDGAGALVLLQFGGSAGQHAEGRFDLRRGDAGVRDARLAADPASALSARSVPSIRWM